jgi:hypothetical protein
LYSPSATLTRFAVVSAPLRAVIAWGASRPPTGSPALDTWQTEKRYNAARKTFRGIRKFVKLVTGRNCARNATVVLPSGGILVDLLYSATNSDGPNVRAIMCTCDADHCGF